MNKTYSTMGNIMRCVRLGPSGQEIPGLLDDNDILRDARPWVKDWSDAALAPDYLADLAHRNTNLLPKIIEPQRLGACVAGVGKIIGIALNYQQHVVETGARPTTEPHVFLKATSSLCGANDPIIMPQGGIKLDWEVELAVVIGLTAKNITAQQAPHFIAGYCLLNDVSERAFQIEHGGQQHTKGKSAASFCPLGPWFIPATQISNPQNINLWTTVNGNTMQQGNTAQMIYGVDALVAYCSQFMTLDIGDIIATGTPEGVGHGMKPPRYLAINDHVQLGGSDLGHQDHRVTA
jgi:2-keto-4-pentenoate hydratase/2-oxohepta-3-ene-1,7-dioic acid hydratase in catechol pathway